MENSVIIDPTTFQELKDLMGGEFVEELIDTYCLETAGLIAQLQQAYQAGDSVQLGRISHSIKSSSASLGALDFSQQARELEMLGKAGDLSTVGPKLDRFSADFLRVKSRLEELRNEP